MISGGMPGFRGPQQAAFLRTDIHKMHRLRHTLMSQHDVAANSTTSALPPRSNPNKKY